MLTHICIDNFMLVEHLELELNNGMTAITGETGTGKSLLLDALGVALGAKTSADCIRIGAEKANITATFSVNSQAKQWLQNHELECSDECIIRRLITKEGRSRSYINGQAVTVAQVRELGEILVDIHSQHAHQSLLKKDHQRRLLDSYGDHLALVESVKKSFEQWHVLETKLNTKRAQSEELTARHQLLTYQVEELDKLDVTCDTLEKLEQEQVLLANAELLLTESNQLVELCDDEQGGLLKQLHAAQQVISNLSKHTQKLANAEQLVTQASIIIQEAQDEIRGFSESVELDPARLQEVELQLSTIYDIARKHKIEPRQLPHLHMSLKNELDELNGGGESIDALTEQAEKTKAAYLKQANKLSNKRTKAAKQLGHRVNQLLQELSMKEADFTIAVESTSSSPARYGIDQIEFLISTNRGHSAKSLHKVASGGELSRISLAIEVVTAQSSHIPTLVFDEVDVGIGGATALVVGKLLATLGNQCQVFCVTHLAQVASFANQHWQVQKHAIKNQNHTTISQLSGDSQIQEIARMISGDQLTKQSLAHAKQMLQNSLH